MNSLNLQTKSNNLADLISRGRGPLVMGILNLSPESFSAVGRVNNVTEAIIHAKKMVKEGADMIDIGAEPTNPVNPASMINEADELAALVPVIKALRNEIDVPISVDTSRPFVMEEVVAAGANMINDIRALRVPGAMKAAASLSVPICLMHMRFLRLPGETVIIEDTSDPNKSLMHEITDFLAARIMACEEAGIARARLILDPGLGAGCFGKNTIDENLTILRELNQLKRFHLPVLVGVSRKLFIGDLLQVPVEERLVGSLVAALAAIRAGCDIIRVHDVGATVQAINMMLSIEQGAILRTGHL